MTPKTNGPLSCDFVLGGDYSPTLPIATKTLSIRIAADEEGLPILAKKLQWFLSAQGFDLAAKSKTYRYVETATTQHRGQKHHAMVMHFHNNRPGMRVKP